MNIEDVKKCCFTGYRPQKFPFKLNNNSAQFCILQSRIERTLTSLIDDDCKVFYSGMAAGFDILCAECVLKLKQKYPDIMLICALPYDKQELGYSSDWRNKFYDILQEADKVEYISKDYSPWCFQDRNKFMVDNSDFIVCWYDGKSGGTKNTIKYAQKLNRFIINLNVEYKEELNLLQTELNI